MNLADYAVWKSQFGTHSIPEPASSVAIWAATGAMAYVRRRRV